MEGRFFPVPSLRRENLWKHPLERGFESGVERATSCPSDRGHGAAVAGMILAISGDAWVSFTRNFSPDKGFQAAVRLEFFRSGLVGQEESRLQAWISR
jgi:hypothetical protein